MNRNIPVSRPRLVVVHTCDREDGELVRVRLVAGTVGEALAAEVVEVAVMPLLRWGWVWWQVRGRGTGLGRHRLVLPIRLPRRPWMLAIGRAIEGAAGRLVGLALKPDAVLGETHGAWSFARGCAAAARAELLMDLHGAVEEVIYLQPPGARRDRIFAWFDAVEADVLRNARLVVCQSQPMAEHVRHKHGGPLVPLLPFECGVRTDLFRFAPEDRGRVRAALGVPPDCALLVYSGNLAKWQMVDEVFSLFAAARGRMAGPARLLVLTRGAPEAVRGRAAAQGLDGDAVHVAGVAHRDVPAYLSAADVGLLLREDIIVNRVASPTKLGEYLACGLPVVTTPVAAHWRAHRADPSCFLIVEGRNPGADAAALAEFIGRVRAEHPAWRARCRALAEAAASVNIDRGALLRAVRDLCSRRPRDEDPSCDQCPGR
jgi:glycosyltransferase involved in cell wall biosynthesis